MIVILFDIDGTLILSKGAGVAALRSAMQELFGVTELADVEVTGRTDRAIVRDLFRSHAVADSAENWDAFRTRYLEHLRHELPKRAGAVLPGVESLLNELTGRDDVCIGLLTGNIQEGAHLKLIHYRLNHHFPFGGFGDHHFDRDYVAAEALAASRQHLSKCDRSPQQVWVIGDTPLDVKCARAIGAKAVAVATGTHTLEQLEATTPDLLLESLEDHRVFLQRLLRTQTSP